MRLQTAFIIQRQGCKHPPKSVFLAMVGETNMVNRKFIPLRSHCCSGGAIHSPLLSSEIQTCFTIQLTILSTGGARHPVLRCLFAPHRQHRCHHPSNSRLASRLLPPSSLVQQAWWGYRSASFWDMKCSIWQWEPQAEKQEAIKVLKGFQAPQGNNAIPYLALNPLVRLSLPHFPIRKAPALFQLYLLSL